MPRLALIIVVVVVIIVGVGATVVAVQHIIGTHTIYNNYTNVTVPTTQNSSSTSTPHPVSGTASGLTIQVSSVIDAKAVAQYRGLGGQKYELLFVTITNDQDSPTVLNPSYFALVGSDGQSYNELALSAFQFTTLKPTPIQPGGSVSGFLAFLLPDGVQPRSLQYQGTSISLAGAEVQYLSVLNITPAFNDSYVIASSGYQGLLIAGINGVPFEMQLEIYNNHSSVPVEVVGVKTQGPLEVASNPTLHVSLPPHGSYMLNLNLSFPDTSVYGSAKVYVLTSLNSSAYSGSVKSLINDTVLAELQGLTGQSYLSYNVTVTYDGGSNFTVLPQDFALVTTEGTYPAEQVQLPGVGAAYGTRTVTYSGGATETLIFKVPSTAVPLQIVYNTSNGLRVFQFNAHVPVSGYVLFVKQVTSSSNDSKVQTSILPSSEANSLYSSSFGGYFFVTGEKIPFVVTVTNGHQGVPVEVNGIASNGPFTVTGNFSGDFVLQHDTDNYQFFLQPGNESYLGDVTVKVEMGFHPSFYNLTVLNSINASSYGEYLQSVGGPQGLTFVVYNVSVRYNGPGSFNINPEGFVLVTNQGDFRVYNYSYPGSQWPSSLTFINGHRYSVEDWIPGVPTYMSFYLFTLGQSPGMNSSSISTGFSTQGYLVFGIPRGAIPESLIYLTGNNLTVFSANATFNPDEYISGVKVVINMISPGGGQELTSEEVVFGINGGSPQYAFASVLGNGLDIGETPVANISVNYPEEPSIQFSVVSYKVPNSALFYGYDYWNANLVTLIKFLPSNQSYWNSSAVLTVNVYFKPI